MALVLNSKALDVALVIKAISGLPHLSLASVLVTLILSWRRFAYSTQGTLR